MTQKRETALAVIEQAREKDGLCPIPTLKFIVPPAISKNVGAQPEFAWLPIGELYIDPEYQRHVLSDGKRNIREMAAEFSWAKFGCLIVGRRGLTRYAVIDGQHRACAARFRRDIAKVPCLILQGGQKQEAACFAAVNANVTRIHPLQAFKASVTAGNPDSIAVVGMCAEAGVTIVAYPKQDLGPGETQCLVNIRNATRRHGRPVCLGALKLLRAMDPGGGLSNTALVGTIGMLGLRHPEWVDRAEELGAKVARPLDAMVKLSIERKATHGGTAAANFEQLLTLAIEASLRVRSRFMDPSMERRAMAGR